MSNTPSDRGADCTALALRKRELVRLWDNGTIDDQRRALLRVLEHHRRKRAKLERLRRILLGEQSEQTSARFLRMVAVGAMHAAVERRDPIGFIQAIELADAADELEAEGRARRSTSS